MERKIGEIFEYNGEWCQCVESKQDACTDCAFNPINGIGYNCSGSCTYKHVIFKKLEKVGEPYVADSKCCQQYQCYTTPLYNRDIIYTFSDNRVVLEIKNKEDMEEKNEVKGANVLSKEEWCIIEKAQEDWKKIFPDIPLMSSMSVDAFFPHIIKLGLLDKYKEHSNSEKIGKNLKPFDLQKAREGKPVCTRDGRKARIICWDRIDSTGCNLPIVALVQCEETEVLQLYHDDGKCDVKTDLDLMMLPEKKEGWVNIYYEHDAPSHREASWVYDKEEEAIKVGKEHGSCYIATVRIEWEE